MSVSVISPPPFLTTSLYMTPLPNLPSFFIYLFFLVCAALTCNSPSLLTPFPPFVLPSRWVHAAAVRWPSCPQCLEPAGCCWWGWPCPQTTGWSWWRASSCSRTRAWRWRWRCTRACGEFASWLVGTTHVWIFSLQKLKDDCRRHTHTKNAAVCVLMSATSQRQAYKSNRVREQRGVKKRESELPTSGIIAVTKPECYLWAGLQTPHV